ncbi:YdeI/OmpD-associated family protein [Candidatus Micrarchaeota archaeon]|nr:YdeI/OmpD-associated family protein [Candidatus Micrarchaeota archaeon]
MELGKTLYVADRKAWRTWLSRHHGRAKEIWLIYYKKSSGKARIPYNDAVDEALCFGWIDSIVKKVDDERFAQRFSPRRRGSVLSQLNKERIRKLVLEKRMTGAGLRAVAHAYDGGSDHGTAWIPVDVARAMRRCPAAWRNFQKFPESYKRIRIAYLEGRRRQGAEPFRRSLGYLVRMTAKDKRFGFVRE